MNKKINDVATLNCPKCHKLQSVKMPADACQHFYKCQSCGEMLKPKEGDCCVFCSYANFYGGKHNPNANNPENDGISPITYLQYISAPISLHQGLVDVEVKPEWSKELNNALKKEGKTVEYFEYAGQDHNFGNLGWDLVSERTVAFYNKYLK